MHPTGDSPASTLNQRRVAIGWAGILAPMPYLVLKVNWTLGGDVGITDPDLLTDPVYRLADGVTIGAELVAIAITLALTRHFGQRLPAWLVLVPMWVATGLLAVIVVLAPLAAPFAVSDSAARAGLEGWVYVLVYAGFAAQGVLLLWAFALYARTRWGHLQLPPPAEAGTTLRAVAVVTGVACATLGVCYWCWSLGLAEPTVKPSGVDRVTLAVYGGFAFAAAASIHTYTRERATSTSLRYAVLGLWVGTSAMTTWGGYYLALAAWHPSLASPFLVFAAVAKIVLSAGIAVLALGLLTTQARRPPKPREIAPCR